LRLSAEALKLARRICYARVTNAFPVEATRASGIFSAAIFAAISECSRAGSRICEMLMLANPEPTTAQYPIE